MSLPKNNDPLVYAHLATTMGFPHQVTFFTGGGASIQGTIGCTPKSVPTVFIVFSRDSWRLYAP